MIAGGESRSAIYFGLLSASGQVNKLTGSAYPMLHRYCVTRLCEQLERGESGGHMRVDVKGTHDCKAMNTHFTAEGKCYLCGLSAVSSDGPAQGSWQMAPDPLLLSAASFLSP